MRIILCPVRLIRRVKCNDLMPKDVISWGNTAGYGDSPAVVGGEKFVSGPLPRDYGTIEKPFAVNLVELEFGLVYRGTLAITVGKVVDDGTVMRVWPFGPLDLDSTTSRNSGVQSCRSGSFVADDVGVTVIPRVDKPRVFVFWDRPSDNRRMAG